MIVKCEQCSTRFKIPDDKVSDKGVKVRCSKCGHTFRIFKDGTLAAAPTRGSGTTQMLPAVPPGAPADPFASFGAAGDPNTEEQTRPVVFTPGVEASKRPDLKPLEPSYAAQADLPSHAFEGPTAIKAVPQPPPGKAPLRTPPPAAGGDFAALFEAAARQPLAPGSFDPFAGFEPQAGPPPPGPQPGDVTMPRAIDPFAATAPRSRADVGTQPGAPAAAAAHPHDVTQPRVDPYAELFKQAPVPAASDLFGGVQPPPPPAPAAVPPPPLPKASPTQPAARAASTGTIPFAHAAAPPPPVETEPATLPTTQVPAYQPATGQELPSADDFFHAEPPPAVTAQKPMSMLPDLEESQHGIEADENAKHALFDLPPPPPTQSEMPQVPDYDSGVAPIGRIALTKVPADQANRPLATGELPAVAQESSGAPRRKVFSVVLNVTIATVLVVAVAIFGSIWLADGKLDRQSFTQERVNQLFKSADLVAFDISNGLYDTRGGRPVFFVRGEVENRGHHVTRVKVRAELVDGESLLRATEVLAGATPTPEQLWNVGQGDDLEKLSQSLSGKAVDLKPGEKASFLVPFYEYPRDLKAFRVRVKVTEAGAQTASR